MAVFIKHNVSISAEQQQKQQRNNFKTSASTFKRDEQHCDTSTSMSIEKEAVEEEYNTSISLSKEVFLQNK